MPVRGHPVPMNDTDATNAERDPYGTGAGRASASPERRTVERLVPAWLAETERHETWATRALGKPLDAFTKYAMTRDFREGELVLHSKFGEGYVEQVLDGGKVSVMFRDGARTLAHRIGS